MGKVGRESGSGAFDQRRSHVLPLLEQNQGDKSRAGGVDGPIADLVASLNSWPDIFTTSSCSGRVSVFAEPTDATRAAGQKGGEWVYVTHGHADAEEIISRVLLCCSNGAPLVFRFEPFILAAEARTADDAQRLIRCAREAGYRESGVTGDESARVIAGIRCSIRLEVPVTDGGLLLVSPEYLRHLTKLANEKMELNWARIERFHALFKQRFLAGEPAALLSGSHGIGLRKKTRCHMASSNSTERQSERIFAAVVDAEAAEAAADEDVKTGVGVQRLLALRSRQRLAQLQELRLLVGDQPDHAVSEGPFWRLAPLHAHGVPSGALHRWGHSMVIVGNKLIIFGGYGGAGAHRRLDDVLVYDIPTGIVRQLPVAGPGPAARVGHVAAALSWSMLVHGGRTAPDQALGDLWLLDLSAKRSSSGESSGTGDAARWVCVDAKGTPPATRHRHSAVSVGGSLKSGRIVMYGGMADGTALEDVWELRLRGKRWHWHELTCTGDLPGPRHSHAAAVTGKSMYVYGGVRDCGQTITGAMHVLDLDRLIWQRINFDDALPRPPPLFSHTLTAVGRYLLVLIGGCPEQDTGVVHMFEVQSQTWMLTAAAAAADCRPVPVRHCAVVAPTGDSMVVIGGGAQCFSFGTTFSRPCVLHLPRSRPAASRSQEAASMSSSGNAARKDDGPCAAVTDNVAARTDRPGSSGNYFPAECQDSSVRQSDDSNLGRQDSRRAGPQRSSGNAQSSVASSQDLNGHSLEQRRGGSMGDSNCQYRGMLHTMEAPRMNGSYEPSGTAEITAQNGSGEKGSWALVVPKQDAKIFKDALKQAGGLNRHRRSLVCDGGVSVALPVTDACAEGLHAFPGKGSKSDKKGQALRMVAAAVAEGQVKVCRMALAEAKVAQSQREALVQAARDFLSTSGLSSERTEDLMAEVPSKWERLGDLVLLPADSFRAPEWAAQGEALWAAVNAALGADRLVRQAPIANTGTRDSQAGLLRGADGWTRHLENGVAFSLDVTRCMFSSGNVTERARMGRLRCASETVVDLFAGIGYYTLPLLVHSRAAKVLACEWNPAAIEALQRNLAFNRCADRCEVLQGNCRQLAPKGVADRVLLGLLPSSREGWPVALAALKPSTGGWLHLHHNVKDSEEAAWIASTQAELETLSRELGRNWRVLIRHVERVKWYAPHMRHLVLDVECRPDQAAVTSAISNGADTDMTTPLTTRLPGRISDTGAKGGVADGNGGALACDSSTVRSGICAEVAEYRGMTRERFVEISREKQPAVLKGLDLGIAVDGWTGAYLKSLPSSSTTLVSVHVCPDPTGRLHFVHKNFEFRTMPLAELVGRCESAEEFPPLISPCERYYLRSIGTNPRKEPSDIAAAFPDLAADLSLPPLFPPDRLFSSVLRISSGGLRLWTHFDVMDNLLCQVRGTKRVRLWPPPEEAKLYMTGSSSEVTDIDQPDPKKYPLFISAVHFDCMLRPGDVLYIPALWHHNVLAEQDSGMSVSVNVFWRDMERGMYAGKDLYGNRDPPAADAAAAAVEAAAKALAQLPPHYRSFYGQRCVRRLVESLEKGFAE